MEHTIQEQLLDFYNGLEDLRFSQEVLENFSFQIEEY